MHKSSKDPTSRKCNLPQKHKEIVIVIPQRNMFESTCSDEKN